MPKERPTTGAWVVRNIPHELMRRTKIAAAIKGISVRQLLLDAVTAQLEDLERKGMMPKMR